MLNKSIYILLFIISTLLICDTSNMSYKVTKEQNKKLNHAKSLRKNGLIDESLAIYLSIFNEYPYLKSALTPLKKILKEQKNWTMLDSIASNYQKAHNFNFQSKIETFEILLWTNNKKYNEILDEVKNNDLISNKNLEDILSTLLYNNKVYEINEALKFIRKNKTPDFFSFQLGLYYSINMEIDKSIEEYLLYLKHNPSKKKLVSNRILSLSDIGAITNKIKMLLGESNLTGAKIILSDFYFREKEYAKAYELIKKYSNNESEKNEFVKNLVRLKEYEIAQTTIADIIKNTQNKKTLQQAVLHLAKIFEKLVISDIYNLPITSNILENELLDSKFLKVNDINSKFLSKAIAIYDSLRINSSDNESTYYLAEIKYRILGDLDGAELLYNNIIKNPSLKFETDAKNRMIDIQISKGNLEKAMLTINKLNANNDYFAFKKMQILFYEHQFDKLKTESNILLKKNNKDNKYYNDMLKIANNIMLFYDNDDALKKYATAMFKLYQNKRIESIDILKTINNNLNGQIVDKINFEIAYLQLLQGNISESIDFLNQIDSNNSAYIESSILLKAEIHDYILNDKSKAVELYLFFIDTFPNSIHYDAIRIRLRDLAS